MIARLAISLLCAFGALSFAATLPVYVEDSHAGTFYWIVRNVAPDANYSLVLIDAHSDSSEILNSDAIRASVLRAASDGTVARLAAKWRSTGAIQCFDWIEPLIPHPLTKVWWVAGESLNAAQVAQKRREVARFINAHEQAWPRDAGDFGRRYEPIGLDQLPSRKFDGPVIASIDLDFFANETSAARIHARVGRTIDAVLNIPNLSAITVAISRPYLASKEQADVLLLEVLRYLTRVVNVRIDFEPFHTTGPDRSERAKELYRAGSAPPPYEIESAPSILRSYLLQNAFRIEVNADRPRWARLLERWRCDPLLPQVTLSIDGHAASDGDSHVIRADTPFQLRLENREAGARVRWKAVGAEHREYNLTGEPQGFADDAPRYLTYRDQPMNALDGRLEIDGESLVPFLDHPTGLGTLRVFAEISNGREIYVSNIVQFSRYRGDGYIGKLTEIFNLPYVYGGALIHGDGKTGADARYGADCANFIVYGRRREGFAIPYVNPAQLLPYLEPIDEVTAIRDGVAWGSRGPIVVTAGQVRDGLLLHFGKHIAAIYEADAGGLLRTATRVVHQLEGVPEITTFGAMAAKYKQIRVMKFK